MSREKPVELPITTDFFVDPRRVRLPQRYGDGRLLLFQRRPDAVVASWDLSSLLALGSTPLYRLELLGGDGRLLDVRAVEGRFGLAFVDGMPPGDTVWAQLTHEGRVVTRSAPLALPSVPPQVSQELPQTLTVSPGERLPTEAAPQAWLDAPPAALAVAAPLDASSR